MKSVKVTLVASLLAATPSAAFAYHYQGKGVELHGWNSAEHFDYCGWGIREVPCFVASRMTDGS